MSELLCPQPALPARPSKLEGCPPADPPRVSAWSCRQLWRCFHTPGTFRALLKALWVALRTWQPIEWPKHHDGKVPVEDALGQEGELAASDEGVGGLSENEARRGSYAGTGSRGA